MKASISIALVTRNRPASLERTLQSLQSQDGGVDEVIISDDSDPDTSALVRDLAHRFGCTYVPGPRRGLYANRNHAALMCRGTHVRTMDDDHTFPAGHLKACQAALADAPKVIWIIGECLPGAEATGVQFHCPGQLHPRGFSTTPTEGGPMWAIADGASIYPRQVFDSGQRFHEGFVFGASYLEWGSRLHWLGYDICHLSNTYVVHHFDATARSYDDRVTDTASRLFAGMSHSFIYQRTLRNRALTVGQTAVTVAQMRQVGVRSVVAAVRAYREHRRVVLGNGPAGDGAHLDEEAGRD